MGFSFLYADREQREFTKDKQANIVAGDNVRFLIPEEFGGGYIQGIYDDYGLIKVFADTPDEYRFDVYDTLALMNNETLRNEHDGKIIIPLYGEDYNEYNNTRDKGIELGDNDFKLSKLSYPFKIVKNATNISYEDCKEISFNDSEQGFYEYDFEELDGMEYRHGYNYKEYLEFTKEPVQKTYNFSTISISNDLFDVMNNIKIVDRINDVRITKQGNFIDRKTFNKICDEMNADSENLLPLDILLELIKSVQKEIGEDCKFIADTYNANAFDKSIEYMAGIVDNFDVNFFGGILTYEFSENTVNEVIRSERELPFNYEDVKKQYLHHKKENLLKQELTDDEYNYNVIKTGDCLLQMYEIDNVITIKYNEYLGNEVSISFNNAISDYDGFNEIVYELNKQKDNLDITTIMNAVQETFYRYNSDDKLNLSIKTYVSELDDLVESVSSIYHTNIDILYSPYEKIHSIETYNIPNGDKTISFFDKTNQLSNFVGGGISNYMSITDDNVKSLTDIFYTDDTISKIKTKDLDI